MPKHPSSCTTVAGCMTPAAYQVAAGNGPDGRMNRIVLLACEHHRALAERRASVKQTRQTHRIENRPTSLFEEGTPHD